MALIRLFLKYLIALASMSFVFWRFFLRIRLPKDLTFEFSFYYIVLAIDIIILHIYIIYRKFYPSTGKLLIKLKIMPLVMFFIDSINDIYLKIYDYLKQYRLLTVVIERIADYFLLIPVEKLYYIYIIFNIIPRYLVALVFFIEVSYYNHMEYFYKSFFLLLLPILLKITLYYFKHWSDTMQSDIAEYVDRHVEEVIIDNIEYYHITFKWKKNITPPEGYDIDYFKYYDVFAARIRKGVLYINEASDGFKIKLAESLISCIYIVTWGYTLFKLFLSFISLLICINIFFSIF